MTSNTVAEVLSVQEIKSWDPRRNRKMMIQGWLSVTNFPCIWKSWVIMAFLLWTNTNSLTLKSSNVVILFPFPVSCLRQYYTHEFWWVLYYQDIDTCQCSVNLLFIFKSLWNDILLVVTFQSCVHAFVL